MTAAVATKALVVAAANAVAAEMALDGRQRCQATKRLAKGETWHGEEETNGARHEEAQSGNVNSSKAQGGGQANGQQALAHEWEDKNQKGERLDGKAQVRKTEV